MLKKSNVEVLTYLSENLEATTPDSEALTIVSIDELMSASALLQEGEENRIAAMSAAVLSLGERTAKELAGGELSEGYAKGEHGYVLLMAAGDNAGVTALAREDANLASIPGYEPNSRVCNRAHVG